MLQSTGVAGARGRGGVMRNILLVTVLGGALYALYIFAFQSPLYQRGTRIADVLAAADATGIDYGRSSVNVGSIAQCRWTPCGKCVGELRLPRVSVSGQTYPSKRLVRFETTAAASCAAQSPRFTGAMTCKQQGYFVLCLNVAYARDDAQGDPFFRAFSALEDPVIGFFKQLSQGQ